jgi:hypothetical protein
MKRLRYLVAIVVVASLVTGASFLRSPSDAERAGWREDLIQLERAIASGFANFEWRIEQRGLDLPAMHRAADSAISAARSERAARAALQNVVAAFDDGHLRLDPDPNPILALARRWAGTGGGTDASIAASTGATSACRQMGFADRTQSSGVGLNDLDGYEPIATEPFPAGVLTLEGNRRVGVVRIARFGEDSYRLACEREWNATVATGTERCDGPCHERIFAGVGTRLLASLDSTLGRLAARGATALLVDVTGNGGGTNLADAIARQLTARPLRGTRVASIRHPHTIAQLRSTDSAVAADLARSDLTDAQRLLLTAARASLDSALARADSGCDLAGRWTGTVTACTILYRGLHSTGVLDYAAPGSLAGLASAGVLFDPSAYAYREGVFAGPLYLLVDRRSASATEQFAALLSDNGAATVIGERTYGAGCGYTDGGLRTRLAHTGLTLRAPDCARFRASGANEAEGIVPDAPAGWSDGDGGTERAEKVRKVLERLLPRAALAMGGNGG